AVGADSRLWIDGTTNLRRWSCKAAVLDAAIDVDVGFREAADFPRYLRKVQVQVPVAELKCGREQMDRSLRKALKADDSTPITHILATFDVVNGGATDSVTVHTIGTLTLAGRENRVKMEVTMTRLSEDGVEARGELPILMT